MPDVARQRLLAGAATAASQAVALIGVAAFGVLIAVRFGTSARTDGFFVANSIYAVAVFIGQSLRSTTVADMVRDRGRGTRTVFQAVLLIAAFAAIVFISIALLAIGPLTARLGEAGTTTARTAMLVLAPSAATQLMCGACAALLAARDRYVGAAWAYTAGTLTALALFMPLAVWLEITAVPLALLIGSIVTAATMLIMIVRDGTVPGGGGVRHEPRLRKAGGLLLGASGLIGAQVIVASSVAFAAQIGHEQATIYSYALMAVSLLIATTVSPATVVFAPVMAREWHGDLADLVTRSTRTFRFGSLFVAPAVAVLVIAGPEPAAQVLSRLSRAQSGHLFETILILSPAALATLAAVIPELALLTTRRFRAVAEAAVVALAFHLAATAAVVAAGGGLSAIASVASASAWIFSLGIVVRATETQAPHLLVSYIRALVALTVVPALLFTAAWFVLARGSSFPLDLAALVCGGGATLLWLLTTERNELTTWYAAIRARS